MGQQAVAVCLCRWRAGAESSLDHMAGGGREEGARKMAVAWKRGAKSVGRLGGRGQRERDSRVVSDLDGVGGADVVHVVRSAFLHLALHAVGHLRINARQSSGLYKTVMWAIQDSHVAHTRQSCAPRHFTKPHTCVTGLPTSPGSLSTRKRGVESRGGQSRFGDLGDGGVELLVHRIVGDALPPNRQSPKLSILAPRSVPEMQTRRGGWLGTDLRNSLVHPTIAAHP